MASSGDITVAQDGGNVKLHPYLVTLVRWCVSCLWSTATVLLHRLMTTPLQPITGIRPPVKPVIPKRAAGTEHLHPEPKVECQLLHQPTNHTVDVIFVHGLYGSLGNTWRQGDWRPKYREDPQKVPLRNHSKPNTCNCRETSYKNIYDDQCDDTLTDLNDPEMSLKRINEKLAKKIIPTENDLITEQFYNNTLLDQEGTDYETQAKFVTDLFKKENYCDNHCDSNKQYEGDRNKYKSDPNIEFNCNDPKFKYNDPNCKYNDPKFKYNDTKCNYEVNEFNECKCSSEKKCDVGCGCICNDCYSTCWPKDWIKMDFPGARVISINYTSDPYLWRPLWIKENKRLNLYQRAEQMIEQLLGMGVGDKPIIWVGHSKGGLFIKQIYCEAYEAYMKTNNTQTEVQRPNLNIKTEDNKETHNGITAENIDTIIGHFSHNTEDKVMFNCNNNINYNDKEDDYNNTESNNNNHINVNDKQKSDFNIENDKNYTGDNFISGDKKINIENHHYEKEIVKDNDNEAEYDNIKDRDDNDNKMENDASDNKEIDNTHSNKNYDHNIGNNNHNFDDTEINSISMKNNDGTNRYANDLNQTSVNNNVFEQMKAKNDCENDLKSINVINDNNIKIYGISGEDFLEREDNEVLEDSTLSIEVPSRASLWSSSRGFMFYSVPHRGSPLADIKTPVTARSVDLLEIAKDCPLVLDLQSRWVRAHSDSRARVSVRSFVETCRTLMSVLWLRIVSTESADAGLGVLTGISVDHREICKPSSRHCLLYTELTDLIHEALKCKCQ